MPSTAPQLVLVSNPDVNRYDDFVELSRFVEDAQPHVHARVVRDVPSLDPELWRLPTLTVSPAPLRRLKPPRGTVLQGALLGKSDEYKRLEAIGIRVPRWALLRAEAATALSGFGPYVVTKPDFGARGADVRIRRSEEVTWTPPKTLLSEQLGGKRNPLIVQDFIHTGPWPVSYRVTTLLGRCLWAMRVEADHARRPLPHPGAFVDGGGISVVSSGRGCGFQLCYDTEIIALAERAHDAFPDIPLLGFDVVREASSGQLFIIEANSLGYTWHFTSQSGLRVQREFGLDLDAQFGGRRRAAAVLGKACREQAR